MFEKEAEELEKEKCELLGIIRAKEELKDKISMALKDPILQQGFEIICKNLAELEKEKCELLGIIQGKDKVIQELKEELNSMMVSKNQQLTKAKEIIKEMLSILPKYDSQGLWLYRRSRALLKEDE